MLYAIRVIYVKVKVKAKSNVKAAQSSKRNSPSLNLHSDDASGIGQEPTAIITTSALAGTSTML